MKQCSVFPPPVGTSRYFEHRYQYFISSQHVPGDEDADKKVFPLGSDFGF